MDHLSIEWIIYPSEKIKGKHMSDFPMKTSSDNLFRTKFFLRISESQKIYMVHENIRVQKRYIFTKNAQFSMENGHFQPKIGQIRFKMAIPSSFLSKIRIFSSKIGQFRFKMAIFVVFLLKIDSAGDEAISLRNIRYGMATIFF